MAGKRNIDVAESASIDLMELNNTIVSMRKVVKTAKVHVIRRLIQQMRRFDKKVDSTNRRNVRVEEIKIIKSLLCDKVSRYALGNTDTFADVCRQTSCSLELKALARLACSNAVQKSVEKFRVTHDDWRSLCSYLAIHQSGRRFRKRTDAKKKGTVVANRKAGDAMLVNFLQDKLTGQTGEEALKRLEKDDAVVRSDIKRGPFYSAEDEKSTRVITRVEPSDSYDISNVVKSKSKIDAAETSKMVALTKENSRKGKGEDVRENVRSSDDEFDSNVESEVDEEGDYDITCSPTAVADELSAKELRTSRNAIRADTVSGNSAETVNGELIVRRLDLSELAREEYVNVACGRSENRRDDDDDVGERVALRDKFFICNDADDSDDGSDERVIAHDDDDEIIGDASSFDCGSEVFARKLKSTFIGKMNARDDGDNTGDTRPNVQRNKLSKQIRDDRGTKKERSKSPSSKGGRTVRNWLPPPDAQSVSNEREVFPSDPRRRLAQPTVAHPSWEASRKNKEQLQNVKFAGKKIKFCDD